MPMSKDEIAAYINEAFDDAEIEFIDLAGDNDHWKLKITSAKFTGKTRVLQHKMVYDALKGHVGGTLHALSLETIAK